MPPHEPDLLLVNGNVLTMDPGHARASAVAVTGGRITAVYDGKPDTGAKDVIDLNGATLIPGFHDAHNHMIGFGLTLSDVDCRVTSLDELYARIAERAKTTPDGDWIGEATTRPRRAATRTATRSTRSPRTTASGSSTPPATCAWSTAWCCAISASTPRHRTSTAAG